MSHDEHERQAAVLSVGCAVITVSDTRTEATDGGGQRIRSLLTLAGHRVCHATIVPDDLDAIQAAVRAAAALPDCQAILLTGGTGIAPRDRTPEALESLLERRLDGFGELFRLLSHAEIGAGAMLSRAVGGIYRRRVVLAMPGSMAAVTLAMNQLVLPQLRHLVWEVNREAVPAPTRDA
jgi:molybdenum cofactor biosynthesis protein B